MVCRARGRTRSLEAFSPRTQSGHIEPGARPRKPGRPRLHPLAARTRLTSRIISTKRESVSLDAGIEKTDFKGVVRHRSGRANQLIKTLRRHDALSFGVDVDAVRRARGLAIDGHDEANGFAF